MLDAPHPAPEELPLEFQRSSKSYATAVILSGIFGFVGVQHFYLGRWVEAILDLGLTFGWIVCLVRGDWLAAVLLLVLDFGHSLLVTVLLITGNFKDGDGRLVCYPGQKLRVTRRR